MIFFTSDQHFMHKNAIEMCDRPFKTVEEMDQALIANWNAKVGIRDEVYILGDISLAKSWSIVHEYLKQLNGNKKYLIKGNHERYLKDQKFQKHFFELITDYHELKYNGHFFVLCHYPLFEWKHKYRGAIHLYGHIHAKDSAILQEQFGRCLNIGVDSNDYAPISADEVIKRMETVPRFGLIDKLLRERKET